MLNKNNKIIDNLFFIFTIISIYPIYCMIYRSIFTIYNVSLYIEDSALLYEAYASIKYISMFAGLIIIGLLANTRKVLTVILCSASFLLHFILCVITAFYIPYDSIFSGRIVGFILFWSYSSSGSLAFDWLELMRQFYKIEFLVLLLVISIPILITYFLDNNKEGISKFLAKFPQLISADTKAKRVFVGIGSWMIWVFLLLLALHYYTVFTGYAKISSGLVAYHFYIFISVFWMTTIALMLIKHHRIAAGIFLTVLSIGIIVFLTPDIIINLTDIILYILAIWMSVFYVIYYYGKETTYAFILKKWWASTKK